MRALIGEREFSIFYWLNFHLICRTRYRGSGDYIDQAARCDIVCVYMSVEVIARGYGF